MARVFRLVSDITGAEAGEDEFVKCVVRTHPAVDEPKSLDVIDGELNGLKTIKDLVVLEIGENGSKVELVVTYAEFKKLVSDDTVKNAAGTRGRKPGFSPKKS